MVKRSENLCFSAEWSAFRKHTSNVLSDLPKLIDSIIKQFPEVEYVLGKAGRAETSTCRPKEPREPATAFGSA